MKRLLKIFRAFAGQLSVLVSAGLLSSALQAADVGKTLGAPKDLPSFQLQDQLGEAFGIEQLKDQWSLVFVGFTSCPDVCPFTLRNLEAVRADMSLRVPPERIPEIVFLAVDPERDQPVLKDYLAYFHPDYTGITGEAKQIEQFLSSLGGFYRLKKKSADDRAYDVVHSAQVFVVSPEAKLVATLNPPFKAHATAEYLTQLMRGRTGE